MKITKCKSVNLRFTISWSRSPTVRPIFLHNNVFTDFMTTLKVTIEPSLDDVYFNRSHTFSEFHIILTV